VRGHQVTHCSVSDDYIVYSIIENNLTPTTDAFKLDNEANFTSIVVIDIANKKEVKIANPSDTNITAVYIDEGLMLIGSNGKIYEMKPSQLFEEGLGSRISASGFAEMATLNTLPDSFSENNEIYAFWHSKSSSNVEVYSRSLRKMTVNIFNYRTKEGQAKFQRM